MALVKPWRREPDVASIGVDGLVKAGVRCVLIDRDNTIVPRDTKQAPKSALAWLDALRAAGKPKLCEPELAALEKSGIL